MLSSGRLPDDDVCITCCFSVIDTSAFPHGLSIIITSYSHAPGPHLPRVNVYNLAYVFLSIFILSFAY